MPFEEHTGSPYGGGHVKSTNASTGHIPSPAKGLSERWPASPAFTKESFEASTSFDVSGVPAVLIVVFPVLAVVPPASGAVGVEGRPDTLEGSIVPVSSHLHFGNGNTPAPLCASTGLSCLLPGCGVNDVECFKSVLMLACCCGQVPGELQSSPESSQFLQLYDFSFSESVRLDSLAGSLAAGPRRCLSRLLMDVPPATPAPEERKFLVRCMVFNLAPGHQTNQQGWDS